MKLLEKLDDAEFLGLEKSMSCDALPCFGCDAGPLPPGCDCICHTPCDFGKTGNKYSIKTSDYESNLQAIEVYEID